ncbi:hypothetical protein [Parabacteroides johnsonii]|jgi:hypothetical protein|uniref:hypothetical protein n=1 Tax=Parabacteroides johnsonii TaxID=387661 RepID=UPI00265D5557|nr:hypothetical protein [Parabacteroides johnsonii]
MHNTATYHFGLVRYELPTASPSLRVAKGNALPIPDKNNTSPDFAGAYEWVVD